MLPIPLAAQAAVSDPSLPAVVAAGVPVAAVAASAPVPAGGLYAGVVAGHHVYLQSGFTVGTWEDCAQFATDAGGSLPAFDEMVVLRGLGVSYAGPHWAADRANGDRALAFSFLSGLSGYSHTSLAFNGLVVRREAVVAAETGCAVTAGGGNFVAVGAGGVGFASSAVPVDIGLAAAPGAIGAAFGGGLYAGVIRGVDGGPDQYLVLLGGDVGDVSWDSAGAWAESVGGSLPTRAEQRLLMANLPEQFQPNWYWSGEPAGPSTAWVQTFLGGYQDYDDRSYEGRAHAVRRLPI